LSFRLASLPEHAQLIAKLTSVADVPTGELAALGDLEVVTRSFARGEDIIRLHDTPTTCGLMLSGFACRYKLVAEGKRQIMAFHIAGDTPDLQSVHLQTMDHSIAALTPTKVAFIRLDDMKRLIYSNPVICHLLWRDTLIDAAVAREWMMGIGRLPADSRVAHLLCELLCKHQAAGLAQERSFPLPVTQQDLADALGLTPVHINRVLQELRQRRLIELTRTTAVILDWDELERLASFDPTYLHLIPRKAA
jgi:CRP-like cAMP-binding protein